MLKKRFLALFIAGQMVFGFSGSAMARLTNQSNETSPDAACWGASGAEVCVDASGNLLPTTDSDTTLGTSSLYWSNTYTDDITVSDDANITGTLTVADPVVITPESTVQTMNLTSSQVTASAGFILLSSTGNITLASGPQISTSSIPNGQYLILRSTAAAITFSDAGVVSGSRVITGTGNSTVVVSTSLARGFVHYDGYWYWMH
jgi:hypothetical protein